MAIRKIVKKGDEILKKKSRSIEEINKKIIDLLDDMVDTLYENKGAGLAAPQVGFLKRMIVVDVGEGLIELINPEIIEAKGEVIDDEGCLSIPGVVGTVKRPEYVRIKGLNRNGETVEYEGRDFLARAFCHEVDHLDGILYTDKAERIQHTE